MAQGDQPQTRTQTISQDTTRRPTFPNGGVLIMTNNTSAPKNKKITSISLTDNLGNDYLFVRTEGKGWFNIAKHEVLTDSRIDPKYGLIPYAVHYTDEQVAELLAEAEERQDRLERTEASLREWIEFRQAWSRKPSKKGKLSLQKKEVAK